MVYDKYITCFTIMLRSEYAVVWLEDLWSRLFFCCWLSLCFGNDDLGKIFFKSKCIPWQVGGPSHLMYIPVLKCLRWLQHHFPPLLPPWQSREDPDVRYPRLVSQSTHVVSTSEEEYAQLWSNPHINFYVPSLVHLPSDLDPPSQDAV